MGKLAAEMHEELERALKNGTFDRYFYGHDMIKGALDRAKLHQRTAVIELRNPILPKDTPMYRRVIRNH